MTLKQIVKNLKLHVQALASEQPVLELFDVDNNAVVFEAADIASIAVGTPAQPNGEFLFANGVTIKIENGVVAEIIAPEVEEEKVEEPEAEAEVVVEAVNEGEEGAQQVEEEPVVEPDEKDVKIAELEAEIAKLQEEVKEKEAEIAEKEAEIAEAEEDLKEIQNFYTKVNKQQEERNETSATEEKKAFCFYGKK